MNQIVWLASYPKSGNTWFRIFLSNLLSGQDEPVDINDLEPTPIASSRPLFDRIVGFQSSCLSHDEVDAYRPEVYDYLSSQAAEPRFHKVHDAYTFLPDGRPLIPATATHGALYFIRNPLDVAVSLANHSSISIDLAIQQMNDAKYGFCVRTHRLYNQLRQKLLTWSGHVQSWLDHAEFDIHVMRYEDMKREPMTVFTEAVRFIGLQKSEQDIERALRFSDFRELQKQERTSGFHEKASGCQAFFHKGEVGYWRSVLTEKQAEKIIEKHNDVMRRFHYLDESGRPIFYK